MATVRRGAGLARLARLLQFGRAGRLLRLTRSAARLGRVVRVLRQCWGLWLGGGPGRDSGGRDAGHDPRDLRGAKADPAAASALALARVFASGAASPTTPPAFETADFAEDYP